MEAVDARREVRDANAGHGLLPLSRAQGTLDGRPSRPCARHGLAGIAGSSYRTGMCRSIKTLRRADEAATTGELEAAARQYVRKISGYRTPSARNAEAFEAAIAEIAEASDRLLEAIGVSVEEGPNRWTPGPPRERVSA